MVSMDYSGKNYIVTGGAGGIGGAVVDGIVSGGGHAVIVDINEAGARKYQEKYGEDKVTVAAVDLSNPAEIREKFGALVQKFGQIHGLICVAGIVSTSKFEDVTQAEWDRVVAINLTGVFHAVKSVVPSMKERKYGHIVVISSIGGRTGRPGVGVNYAATKAGVNGLVMCLGYELGPWQITVNSVAPGPLKGKMFAGMTQDRIESLSAGIRLQRMGELSDVAAAIAYLGSDDAAWTTGEVLDVNGGLQY
mgnify:CR=1 FL=1